MEQERLHKVLELFQQVDLLESLFLLFRSDQSKHLQEAASSYNDPAKSRDHLVVANYISSIIQGDWGNYEYQAKERAAGRDPYDPNLVPENDESGPLMEQDSGYSYDDHPSSTQS